MEGIKGYSVGVCNRGVWFQTGGARDKKGWNDEVRIAVLEKRKVFEQWLQQGTEQAFKENRKERRRVKAVVTVARREAEDILEQS